MSGSQMRHSGGLNQLVVELGFDQVKYFELVANTVAQTITFNTPARRLSVSNKEAVGGSSVFVNVTGVAAAASAGITPGDNIRIRPTCTFTMDFDAFTCVSIIADVGTAQVDALLGFKGTR